MIRTRETQENFSVSLILFLEKYIKKKGKVGPWGESNPCPGIHSPLYSPLYYKGHKEKSFPIQY